MASSLSEGATVRYSPSERLVFDIIKRKSQPITSTAIVAAFYKAKGKKAPYNSRQIVMGSLRSLLKKMAVNKETVKIERIKKEGNKVLEYQVAD